MQRLRLGCTNHDVQASAVSEPYPECERQGQEQGNGQIPGLGDQIIDVSSSSGSATHANEDEEMAIANILATDVAAGLRRIPAGFYIAIQHGGIGWRTANKPVSVTNDVVEWDGPIPMPSDLSATVWFGIYASFEFQPTLGHGELLRDLTVTVQQLLDRSSQDLSSTFSPKDRDVVSPCSSLFVGVGRRKRENGDSFESRVIDPRRSTTASVGRIEEVTNLGHSALSCYRKDGERRDLEHSIEQFELALDICPLDHPGRAVAQSNLAMAKFIRSRVDNSDASLEVPISLYNNALAARPPGHLDRPSTLLHLAVVLLAQFEKRPHEVYAAQAEEFLHEVMDLSFAESHEQQAAIFMLHLRTRRSAGPNHEVNFSSVEQSSAPGDGDGDPLAFSSQLLQRFEQFGDLAELQLAISLLEPSVSPTSVSDHQYPERLTNLGVALMYRFRRLGALDDLEEAISRYGDALGLTPDGHPDKPSRLNNLVHSSLMRFERLGEPSDLERAISKGRNAVELTSDGYSDKPPCLNNLALCFKTRFERFGALTDLEQAISQHRNAIELTPDGHPDKAGYLNNLANAFLIRFEHLGELSNLEEAISRYMDAGELTPDNHPNKPIRLNNLANSLITRFEHLGKLSDLEQAILRYRDAIELTPDGHPVKCGCLNNLASSFLTRFEHLGELDDLEQAIQMHRDAIELIPDGHPDKPGCLRNLASCFKTRFQRVGDLGDLEQAISRNRHAIEFIPDGHPDKPGYLCNLASCFRTRFTRLGELSDLEQAISRHRCAVELTPDGHIDKPTCLNNLALCLLSRFECLGELSDLEKAISALSDAVELIPHGHPNKPCCLNSLGLCFLARLGSLGNPSDLERTISTHKDAVELTPDCHPAKPGYLGNLADPLICRFKYYGEVNDIEQAISMYRNALELIPDGHPDTPSHLNNFASCFKIRFEKFSEPSDLEQAISMYRDAVELTPDDHPHKPRSLNNLALCFKIRFEQLSEPCDLEQATLLHSQAARASTGPTTTRFRASLQWISCARSLGNNSLLHAYSVAIDLLPQLAWIGLPLTHRYRELRQGADVVREAAAAALDSGRVQTAVEWLEQGRSIVWGELFQLRSSYEELSSAHPDHASRLRKLSVALEHTSAVHDKSLSSILEQAPSTDYHSRESLEQVADRYRALAIERDKLLQEIRGLSGFERFLLHKEFSQLRTSAHTGPVVILNAAESRCDALIVIADVEDAIHIPLPNFTLRRSGLLQKTVNGLLGHARDERDGRPAPRERVGWESVLSVLWKGVVKPVLDGLDFSTPGDLSRIFWCPTGPFTFLPIHAAGLYGTRSSEPGYKVSDFVISSYVPTLSILAPSPTRETNSSGDLRLLAVRQPPSDGQSHLPGVDAELEHIRAIIRNSPSARTTFLEPSIGTVEEVLSQMKETHWVHFACHGIQDSENPADSGLCLANQRRLKLSDIISLSRPRGGLAFLSACETAMGDEDLSDEAIHIAAGMLFAGYGGVIGTMWSIADRVAPHVAKDVYKQLFQNGGTLDYQEAARALHDAVGRLRENNASFVEWLPFIHVGL